MTENFLNLGKETDMQLQEVPTKMYSKEPTARNIIIKMSNNRDRDLGQQEKNKLLHTRELSGDYQQMFQHKFCTPGGSGTI